MNLSFEDFADLEFILNSAGGFFLNYLSFYTEPWGLICTMFAVLMHIKSGRDRK